jgi:hypothetical protein
MRSILMTAAGVALAAGLACAPKVQTRPAGAGTPAPNAPAAWGEAIAPCNGIDTDSPTLEIAGGRIDGDRVPGLNVLGALTVRNEVRLHGNYRGQTVFTLSGALDRALLELPPSNGAPREHVVARADEIVAVLIGLRIAPVDLLRVLTGCVGAGDQAVGEPARHGSLIAIRTRTAQIYLAQRSGRWRVAMADLAGLQVDYRAHEGDWPSDVVISSAPAATAVVRLRVHQQLINSPDLVPAAFVVTIPSGSREITLDDLRRRFGRG